MADYTLATAIGANDTSIKLVTSYALTGSGYPGRLSCQDEILYVTGGAGTSTISVLRGADGTDAVAHATGTAIADANLGTGGGATPTLAEVLVAGNDPGTTDFIQAAQGMSNGGPYLQLQHDLGTGAGGYSNLAGGDGVAGQPGGDGTLDGGSGNNDGPTSSEVVAGGGGGDGTGGDIFIRSGQASLGTGRRGGDITLYPRDGDGTGRNGLVFLNLPTADPLVAGALWANLGIVIVSAG